MSRSVSELKSSEPSAGLNRWGAFLDRFEAIRLLGQTPTAEVESSLGHAARLFWFLLRQIPRHLKLAGPHPRCLSDISPSELSVRHRETFNPIRSRKDKGQWLLFHKGWFWYSVHPIEHRGWWPPLGISAVIGKQHHSDATLL